MVSTVSEISIETLLQYHGLIVGELNAKLHHSRLQPLMSSPGIVSGFVDREFVARFGVGLTKVGIADVAALTLYLEPAPTMEKALANLYEHIRSSPEGKTGLPYFDEWAPSDDYVPNGIAEVWSNDCPGTTRGLLADKYRIRQSVRDASGNPGFFLTIFFQREEE